MSVIQEMLSQFAKMQWSDYLDIAADPDTQHEAYCRRNCCDSVHRVAG